MTDAIESSYVENRDTRGDDSIEALMHIFVSHSHRDRAIADALAELLGRLFDGSVDVHCSSSQRVDGGIAPGERWWPWIKARIAAADKTFVLLTPSSLRRPWVLWESGAAAGIAMAADRSTAVVPITFGIDDRDIPSPFLGTQCVKGDSLGPDGIRRLLFTLNNELDTPRTGVVLGPDSELLLQKFLDDVDASLRRTTPVVAPLHYMQPGFSARRLGGMWATTYEFVAGGETRCHADLTILTAESDGRINASNDTVAARTEGRRRAYRNDIAAQLVGRHLLGEWKNASDERFFGTIHLAVLSGENVMEGHYTALAGDERVVTGTWKWARVDRNSVEGVDLADVELLEPRHVRSLIMRQDDDDPLLRLSDLSEAAA